MLVCWSIRGNFFICLDSISVFPPRDRRHQFSKTVRIHRLTMVAVRGRAGMLSATERERKMKATREAGMPARAVCSFLACCALCFSAACTVHRSRADEIVVWRRCCATGEIRSPNTRARCEQKMSIKWIA